ncbi:N-formylglutamate amidohydrolase [Tropicimonas sediminicola]|nr:N-formylglutamate amidohydrolase [Tropicimonas sediminicola]
MIQATESSLLGPKEGPPVRTLNAGGRGGFVLVCEHASRFIPAALGELGLDEEAKHSHAAWDIGARDLAVELMAELDAPLVAARVSRLVYDCNRPPEAHDAVPARSERFEIPGNRDLAAAAREQRAREIYAPFRKELTGTLDRRNGPALLVTIHSFTPVYMGRAREVELGLLHDADARMADAMMAIASRHTGMATALNAPYAASDGVTHTLRDHGVARGLANVMIEVRNDLIDTPSGVHRVAAELAGLLREIAPPMLADTAAPATAETTTD